MDQGDAAFVAAGVALVVGLGGVATSIVLAVRSGRDALRLQYTRQRAAATFGLLEIVEAHSHYAHDRVFNLTQARSDDDEFTNESGNYYGPHRRVAEFNYFENQIAPAAEALADQLGVEESTRRTLETLVNDMLRAE